ncbi:GspE/PulE family protein [Acetobacterium tundrae]|uniref:Type II secretion system protein GspE n=1 Tax=Acetobacterium tundrae TaxID=132932 RepID=A0ABR6WJL8_9FIRM|nr:GspE/PulE family protein [Acetobacterium tundrae]MBC3796694.1 type II secretion system protein GspE [Acetobacterium tundrae]
MKENKFILERLLKNKEITRQDITDRIQEAQQSDRSLLDLLLEDRVISPEKLLLIFHKEWGFNVYDPQKDLMDSKVLFLFTKEQALEYLVFPLNQPNEEHLIILMADPTDEEVIRILQQITKKRLKILVAEKECIQSLIRRYYNENTRYDEDISKKTNHDGSRNEESSIINLVNEIIDEGVTRGASDIHIEAFPKKFQIRLRIDGLLQLMKLLEEKTWHGVISRLKILGGCDIAEHRFPQDGAFTTRFEGRQIDVRVSIMPTIHGEKIVLRLLDQCKFLMKIEELGFSSDQKILIKDIMDSPHGMILASGPTGSGKSTTLYSLLNGINSETQNIITIEDPVEFQMEDVNQIQVNEKTGLNFAMGLRSILRQDPNVIMVGEIRDEETAAMATRAAITGHLVLSTIHTNNAIASITRLMDMKVPLYLLSSALRGIISQKLIKRLCPNCKKEGWAAQAEKDLLGLPDEKIKLYYPEGCPLCHGTGYRGRLAVQEVLKITRNIRESIGQGKDYDSIRQIAMEEGLIPIEESLKQYILNGSTSFAEGFEILAFEKNWHH